MSTNELPATNEVSNQTSNVPAALETTVESPCPDLKIGIAPSAQSSARVVRLRFPGGAASTPLSPNKLAANRRNARRSTGPRTVVGKLASRMNAVRHGILSSAVVVRGVRIQEQEDEFKALRDQSWECLVPVGRVEEMLVDKIVTAWWRSRRALIAETGEIVKSVDGGLRRREDGATRVYATLIDPIRDASASLEGSTDGLDFLSTVLQRVREGMAKDGELTYGAVRIDGEGGSRGGPNALTRRLWEYLWKFRDNLKAVKVRPGGNGENPHLNPLPVIGRGDADEVGRREDEVTDTEAHASATAAPFAGQFSVEEVKERHQLAVERYIELKLIDYTELRRKCLEREDKSETVHQAADVLPSSEVLEKIMRYEGSLERQLYRALNQLERLQRRRGGEKVAAPLMMDVMR